ncbi:Scr1 family TA system antitoxin-like transcriptional regulator [Nocardia thraciensis]
MSADIAVSDPQFRSWRDAASSTLQQDTGRAEAGTEYLRIYDPDVVSGLLQTREYATAILTVCLRGVGAEHDLPAAVEVRMARQQQRRQSGHRTHILIGEQALYTRVGDAATTRAQLDALLLRPLPNTIRLGIVPRTAQYLNSVNNFMVFDDREVAVETMTGGLRFTGRDAITDYLTTFDALAAHAVTDTAAEQLIARALASHF